MFTLKKIIVCCSLVCFSNLKSQNIGINATGANADPSAALDIVSINKGLLIPRVALTSLNSALPIVSPLISLMVYNTATAGTLPNNVVPGYYYWDGTKWVSISGAISGGLNWNVLGNAGTAAGTNFIGTTDAQDLVFKTNSIEQMRVLTTGNFGIGLSSPLAKLHVSGGDIFDDFTDNTQNTLDPVNIRGIQITNKSTLVNTSAGLFFASSIPAGATAGIFGKAVAGDQMDMHFWTENNTGRADKMIILNTGFVGIGTNAPGSLLHLNSVTTTGLTLDGNGASYNNAEVLLRANNGSNGRGLGVFMNDNASLTTWFAGRPYGVGNVNGSDQYQINRTTVANPSEASAINDGSGNPTVTKNFFSINNNGYVGMGTINPTNDLHIEKSLNGDVVARLWNPNTTGNSARELLVLSQANGGKYGYLAHHNDGYSNVSYPNLYPNSTLLSAGVGDLLLASGTTTNDVYIGSNGMNSQNMIVKGTGNVGINTLTPNNKLEITATGANSSGLRFTNLTSASPTIASNGKVLSVDVNGDVILVPSSAAATGNNWSILGNSGTVDGTNFIGTTDNVALNFRVNNFQAGRVDQTSNVFLGFKTGGTIAAFNNNTGIGYQALFSNTSGANNTAIGYGAAYSNSTGANNVAIGLFALKSSVGSTGNFAGGAYALEQNTTGGLNAALGYKALSANLSGNGNTSLGYSSMFYNTTGSWNTATGVEALYSNTIGDYNTTSGFHSLSSNTTGNENTAMGYLALFGNTTGNYNSALGVGALNSNGAAVNNCAIGYNALYFNTGDYNVATGCLSLLQNTTGNKNTADGYLSLRYNTTGVQNTAQGLGALVNNTIGNNNSSLGFYALGNNTTGNNNLALGYGADVSANNFNNASAIGYNSTVNASDKIRLGNTFVTVIEGQVAYSFPSDARFKTNVTEDVKGLDFITRLRPVTYNFDTKKFDEFLMKNMPDSIRQLRMKDENYEPSTSIRQTGFIAQEVEKVLKEIGFDFNGLHVPANEDDNYSIAYSQFIMPLVKAVQELNQKNEQQQQLNQDQQQTILDLKKAIEVMQNKLEILEKK